MSIQFSRQGHERVLWRANRTKGILLFIVASMLFVKYSIAQTVVPSDTLNQTVWVVSDKAVKDSTVRIVSGADSIKNPIKPISSEIVKDSIVKPTVTSQKPKQKDKLSHNKLIKDSIPTQVNKNEKRDEQFVSVLINIINKRITDDSIAQSDAIYELYKLITKKIADDSIAKSVSNPIDAKHGGTQTPNKIEKNSTAKQNIITFDAGQVFSTFKFTGNQGSNGQSYSHNITSSYSLGYHYAASNELFYRANIGMRGAGASLVNDGIIYNWTIQYFDASVGVGYMYNLWRIKPYFSASPYFGYMLKGNQTTSQTTGSVNFDLIQNKSLKTTDFGLFFSPGVRLALSDFITLYAEYKYILGLNNLETSSDQKSYNRGFSFNLGVAITIAK